MAASFWASDRLPDQAAAARGQKLFVQTCGFCHGANATGAEGPDLLALHASCCTMKRANSLGPSFCKGRPDQGMPSFSGTDRRPDLRHRRVSCIARVEAAANRFGYKMQNVVTGNAKAGEAFFNGAGTCSTCHSPTGDLAHIAKQIRAGRSAVTVSVSESVLQLANGEQVRGARHVTVTLPSGEIDLRAI